MGKTSAERNSCKFFVTKIYVFFKFTETQSTVNILYVHAR